jgi:hypothetical protein
MPAVHAEMFLVPIRKRWTGLQRYQWPGAAESRFSDLDLEVAKRTKPFSEDQTMKLFGSPLGTSTTPDQPDDVVLLADLADDFDQPPSKKAKGAKGAKSSTGQFYWQIVPQVTPCRHVPERVIYHNANYQSIPWHIGRVLDSYDGDPDEVKSRSLHYREQMRNAIFPEDDSDSFKTDYYGEKADIPRVELDLRPRTRPVLCL